MPISEKLNRNSHPCHQSWNCAEPLFSFIYPLTSQRMSHFLFTGSSAVLGCPKDGIFENGFFFSNRKGWIYLSILWVKAANSTKLKGRRETGVTVFKLTEWDSCGWEDVPTKNFDWGLELGNTKYMLISYKGNEKRTDIY